MNEVAAISIIVLLGISFWGAMVYALRWRRKAKEYYSAFEEVIKKMNNYGNKETL